MTASRSAAGDSVTLAFERTLDAHAVARAREVLRRCAPRETVVLDFGKVRDVDWFSLEGLGIHNFMLRLHVHVQGP